MLTDFVLSEDPQLKGATIRTSFRTARELRLLLKDHHYNIEHSDSLTDEMVSISSELFQQFLNKNQP